jgi:hypothetical protein
MKVAYIFTTNLSHRILSTMVIPQMEEGRHGVDVAGMFFFADNCYMLTKGNAVGERLKKLMDQGKIQLLMGCDQCAYEREIDKKLIDGARIGCFPDLYAALGPAKVDQVITL